LRQLAGNPTGELLVAVLVLCGILLKAGVPGTVGVLSPQTESGLVLLVDCLRYDKTILGVEARRDLELLYVIGNES
jgi:hypothetical protein